MDWRQSFLKQIKTLENINDKLNELEVNAIIDQLASCCGLRFFTGVGKNGHVASKVASTYNSLGLRSIFVDPVHAVHGDMGLFTQDDILVAISNSGSTEELLVFLNALTNVGFDNVIGVHSKRGSQLDIRSKYSIYIPVLSEGDHLGIAPVASSISFMSILQSFAVEISSKNGFTKADFVKTHPGGALGKIKLEESVKNG